MIKKQKLFLIFITFLLSNYGFSQETKQNDTIEIKRFSLSEAQNYAIENNVTAKNKQIDIAIAKKKVWETTAIGLPQLSAKVSWQYQFTVPTLEMATLVPVPIEETPDPADHFHELQYNSIELGSQQNTTIDFTVTQLIFNGEYIVGLQATKVFKSISEKSLEKTEIETREQIAQTYYLSLVLKQNAEILDTTFANMEKLKNDMEQMYKQGFIEETDYSQISLTALNIKNAQISLNRQTEVVNNLLKLQMGLEFETKIELTDTLQYFLNESEFEALVLKDFSVEKNIDYQMLTIQEQVMSLSLKREKAKYLPTVAAFYRHQEQINAPAFNFMPPDIVGISVDIPIFSSGMRNSKVKQAQLELEKVQNTKTQVYDALSIEFEKSKNDFLAAQDKYKNLSQNYQLSKSIYDKTLIKYNKGVSSSFELTQAQNQYFSSQSNYFQAVVELLNAKAKLDKLLNSTSK